MLLLLKLLIFDLSLVTSHEITDFQGITLTAMTHAYSPAIMLHDNYTKTSMYFPENDTYEVTNQVYGLYLKLTPQFSSIGVCNYNFASFVFEIKL